MFSLRLWVKIPLNLDVFGRHRLMRISSLNEIEVFDITFVRLTCLSVERRINVFQVRSWNGCLIIHYRFPRKNFDLFSRVLLRWTCVFVLCALIDSRSKFIFLTTMLTWIEQKTSTIESWMTWSFRESSQERIRIKERVKIDQCLKDENSIEWIFLVFNSPICLHITIWRRKRLMKSIDHIDISLDDQLRIDSFLSFEGHFTNSFTEDSLLNSSNWTNTSRFPSSSHVLFITQWNTNQGIADDLLRVRPMNCHFCRELLCRKPCLICDSCSVVF